MNQIAILSWNIQNGLGTDGKRSLDRIASVIEAMGRPEVICLQEVSRSMPLDADVTPPDQVAELCGLFSEYQAVFGVALDMRVSETNQTAQYGNLILSRLPILSSSCHPLPQPLHPGVKQMPRQATEITVDTGKAGQLLRVMTTHLEFHSQRQRLAQVGAMRAIHEQIVACNLDAPAYTPTGPYQQLNRASPTVICGDLNCLPGSTELDTLIASAELPEAQLREVWQAMHPAQEHLPTCGIFDRTQWPQGPHCRDYFVASADLIPRCQTMVTNTETNASDHQPICLTIAF